jgi:hypothetical protein
MKPAEVLERAITDGLTLSISSDEKIKIAGDQNIINEWLPLIREHKSEIVQLLKQELRHQRVLKMLDSEPGKTYAVIVDDATADPVLASIAIKGLAVFDLHIPLAHYDGIALLEVIEQHSMETADKLSTEYPLPQQIKPNLSRPDERQRKAA